MAKESGRGGRGSGGKEVPKNQKENIPSESEFKNFKAQATKLAERWNPLQENSFVKPGEAKIINSILKRAAEFKSGDENFQKIKKTLKTVEGLLAELEGKILEADNRENSEQLKQVKERDSKLQDLRSRAGQNYPGFNVVESALDRLSLSVGSVEPEEFKQSIQDFDELLRQLSDKIELSKSGEHEPKASEVEVSTPEPDLTKIDLAEAEECVAWAKTHDLDQHIQGGLGNEEQKIYWGAFFRTLKETGTFVLTEAINKVAQKEAEFAMHSFIVEVVDQDFQDLEEKIKAESLEEKLKEQSKKATDLIEKLGDTLEEASAVFNAVLKEYYEALDILEREYNRLSAAKKEPAPTVDTSTKETDEQVFNRIRTEIASGAFTVEKAKEHVETARKRGKKKVPDGNDFFLISEGCYWYAYGEMGLSEEEANDLADMAENYFIAERVKAFNNPATAPIVARRIIEEVAGGTDGWMPENINIQNKTDAQIVKIGRYWHARVYERKNHTESKNVARHAEIAFLKSQEPIKKSAPDVAPVEPKKEVKRDSVKVFSLADARAVFKSLTSDQQHQLKTPPGLPFRDPVLAVGEARFWQAKKQNPKISIEEAEALAKEAEQAFEKQVQTWKEQLVSSDPQEMLGAAREIITEVERLLGEEVKEAHESDEQMVGLAAYYFALHYLGFEEVFAEKFRDKVESGYDYHLHSGDDHDDDYYNDFSEDEHEYFRAKYKSIKQIRRKIAEGYFIPGAARELFERYGETYDESDPVHMVETGCRLYAIDSDLPKYDVQDLVEEAVDLYRLYLKAADIIKTEILTQELRQKIDSDPLLAGDKQSVANLVEQMVFSHARDISKLPESWSTELSKTATKLFLEEDAAPAHEPVAAASDPVPVSPIDHSPLPSAAVGPEPVPAPVVDEPIEIHPDDAVEEHALVVAGDVFQEEIQTAEREVASLAAVWKKFIPEMEANIKALHFSSDVEQRLRAQIAQWKNGRDEVGRSMMLIGIKNKKMAESGVMQGDIAGRAEQVVKESQRLRAEVMGSFSNLIVPEVSGMVGALDQHADGVKINDFLKQVAGTGHQGLEQLAITADTSLALSQEHLSQTFLNFKNGAASAVEMAEAMENVRQAIKTAQELPEAARPILEVGSVMQKYTQLIKRCRPLIPYFKRLAPELFSNFDAVYAACEAGLQEARIMDMVEWVPGEGVQAKYAQTAKEFTAAVKSFEQMVGEIERAVGKVEYQDLEEKMRSDFKEYQALARQYGRELRPTLSGKEQQEFVELFRAQIEARNLFEQRFAAGLGAAELKKEVGQYENHLRRLELALAVVPLEKRWEKIRRERSIGGIQQTDLTKLMEDLNYLGVSFRDGGDLSKLDTSKIQVVEEKLNRLEANLPLNFTGAKEKVKGVFGRLGKAIGLGGA